MKQDLVMHFYNEVPEALIDTLVVLNNHLKKKLSKLNVEVNVSAIPDGDITVVGIVSETPASKYLKIGVSRCAANDTFSRKQGREFAKWRASNAPSLRMKFDTETNDSEIQEFFANAGPVLNKKFKTLDNIHQLKAIPAEIKDKFKVKRVEKRAWTAEEIQKAKDEAFFRNSHSEMGSFVINDSVADETETQA